MLGVFNYISHVLVFTCSECIGTSNWNMRHSEKKIDLKIPLYDTLFTVCPKTHTYSIYNGPLSSMLYFVMRSKYLEIETVNFPLISMTASFIMDNSIIRSASLCSANIKSLLNTEPRTNRWPHSKILKLFYYLLDKKCQFYWFFMIPNWLLC